MMLDCPLNEHMLIDFGSYLTMLMVIIPHPWIFAMLLVTSSRSMGVFMSWNYLEVDNMFLYPQERQDEDQSPNSMSMIPVG